MWELPECCRAPRDAGARWRRFRSGAAAVTLDSEVHGWREMRVRQAEGRVMDARIRRGGKCAHAGSWHGVVSARGHDVSSTAG
jgi:hypothetical protein